MAKVANGVETLLRWAVLHICTVNDSRKIKSNTLDLKIARSLDQVVSLVLRTTIITYPLTATYAQSGFMVQQIEAGLQEAALSYSARDTN